MIHYLTFAGKSSRDFGVFISGAKTFGSGARDFEQISIPGRNGDLLFDNGRFKNVKVTYSAYIVRNFNTNYNAFNSWLMSKRAYARLEDTYQPDIYRLAFFSAGLQSEPVIRLGVGAFNIEFNCKPQKYLKSGEIPVTYTGAGEIYNVTEYDARPLIRCYGTGGTVTVNGIRVNVTGCSAYVDLDCDLMEAYEGAANRNGTTTLLDGDFPVLKPGSNAVSFTGWSKVEIVPRWWRI